MDLQALIDEFKCSLKTTSFGSIGPFDSNVDPPFCPPSTCPSQYLFGTLQQFPDGSLLLI